ncbi:ESX secretion-associated protein EspG [Longimycelium tulufanense]|uniref:ESX secretion-associated protein EspG n=1 Tax=Longimycelium tulufanense TaxID=907463 RepID=A0A8J3CDN8_9PSEU|nr:ESX secretion-associated protein EspG [Longimycelium tulufanense]GGM51996.1 ESX secretion-associated protein EspG [Longimycelium tulufanense]
MTVFGERTEPATVLSASAYQVLWEHLGLPSMPIVLLVNPRGYEEDERRAVVEAAWNELRSSGLVGGRGMDPGLRTMLELLARPTRSIDVRMWLGHEVRALVAGDGYQAAVGVLAEDRLTLRLTHPGGLSRTAAGLLPSTPPGPGRSVSIAKDLAESAADGVGHDVKAFENSLRAKGARGSDAHHLAEMLDGPDKYAQFGANMRDRLGRERRADHVVAWYATPKGGYVMEDHRSFDGRLWTTIAPADPRRISGQIDRLFQDLERQLDTR